MKYNMKTKFEKFILGLFFWIGLVGNVFNLASANNFNDAMWKSVDMLTKANRLDAPIINEDDGEKAEELIDRIVDVFFSVMVVAGVLVAMVGFYQVLTSGDESQIKTWTNTIIYWVIWILIMFAAKYLTGVIFDWIFAWWTWKEVTTVEMIRKIYWEMVYPFIKIAIYLSLGVLVILMIVRVFTYITAQDDSTKEKSMWVIIWSVVGMLLITWAKQVVEAVYWKQEEVLKTGVTNLSKVGTRLLKPEDIPIVYNVINRALWLVAFALLVIIIIQTYKILTKPDDAATFTSLKKTIIYALAWVLLIGAAYLLSNLFIIW